MLPTGDSDLDSDEDGLIEFANKQEGEGGVTITGVGTQSGIKIVRTAKDNVLSQ